MGTTGTGTRDSAFENTLCLFQLPRALLFWMVFPYTVGNRATDSLGLTFSCVTKKERSSFLPAPASRLEIGSCSHVNFLNQSLWSSAAVVLTWLMGLPLQSDVQGVGGGHRLAKDNSHFAAQHTHPLPHTQLCTQFQKCPCLR